MPKARPYIPWLTIAAILLVTTAALKLEGRILWCDCGHSWLLVSDVWSHHCSPHPFDPYSLTHLSHGLIFFTALALLAPRLSIPWRLCTAIAIAAAWEIVENSTFIIDRYRTATMSLDYLGDSVINSLGDIASCWIGFVIAQRVGWRWTLAIFLAIELVLLALIRDNLTLNVIMLIYPIHVIKAWQSVGHSAVFICLAAAPPSHPAASPAPPRPSAGSPPVP